MSTCSIIIKIKDYFPKIDSIPYQNFICLFTNGESEGQIPLMSKDTESYKHQMKNILSDIKYKIHVLDYNDMSLIGMCEMVISYNIISQITPPNGFIQEQQKKLLIDSNTKRKLFGTVLNMGDIYLNLYSEIYLVENKNNITNISSRKKNKIWGMDAKKKLDGSPRTVHKKQLMMQINSDRRALISINKNENGTLDKKIKYKNITSSKIDKNLTSINNPGNNINYKPNSSFNYKDIIPQQKENKIINMKDNKINNNIYKKISNNNIKNKNSLKNKPNKNSIKNNLFEKNNFLSNNNEKEKENNLINNNIYSRYKTESNKNAMKKKSEKSDKRLKNIVNKQSLVNSVSPKLSNDTLNEKGEIVFNNNTDNKITTIESLENIDFSGKKYITKEKPKKNNSQSYITAYNNNTLFSTSSTEQEFNEMDKIILEKGTEIRNDFNSQLKNNKKISLNNNINNTNIISNNNNTKNNIDIPTSNNIIQIQAELKNNFIKLIEFYSLLSQKLVKIREKNNILFNKNVIYKEKLFTELKINNALTQKKTVAEVDNFMNINNHGSLNEKFLRPIIKMKKLEFKIFQNIFNIFYYEYDILKFKEFENNKKLDENVKIELLLMVFKNLVKNYGNISQIYSSNNIKMTLLKNCFNKYGIQEEENGEGNISTNLENVGRDKILEKNKGLEKKENKNEEDKFKVIKEVDEEKEEEYDDEDKLNLGNSGHISNNHISYSNSNIKENNNIITNEKNKKTDNKGNKNISGQKKLFETNEDNSESKNEKEKENKLEDVKYNLSEKIIEHDDIVNDKNTDEINKAEEIQPIEKEHNIDNIEKLQNNNIDEYKIENDNQINKDITNNESKDEINEKENSDKIFLNQDINNNNPNNNENKKEIETELNEENNIDIMNIKENNEIIKEKEEKPKGPTKREIYTRKNRQKYKQKETEKELQDNNNNIINNDKAYYKKNIIKKEIYDEEDLIMQKILIEDFPKKCKEENRFIRISKNEYSFGEEKIKVAYKDGIVILQLDEGDYKLQEFIDILNEGKNEEENFNKENKNDIGENIEKEQVQEYAKEYIQEQYEENKNIKDEIINSDKKELLEENEITEKKETNNSDKKDNISEKNNNNSSSSEKKQNKRRKKRVNEDISFEKEDKEKEQNSEEDKKNEKKEIVIEKENDNNHNSDISDINKVSNTEENESDINSENKGRKYVIKRRRDYKQKKLK